MSMMSIFFRPTWRSINLLLSSETTLGSRHDCLTVSPEKGIDTLLLAES